METKLCLTPDAILYAASQVGADRVIGVPDTLVGLTVADYPAFTKRAVDELTAAKCIEMDFDGNQEITADFENLIRSIVFCKSVTTYSVRKTDESNVTYTVYVSDDGMVLSKRAGDRTAKMEISVLEDISGIYDIVSGDIESVTEQAELKESAISTAVLNKKDKQAIVDTGCDEITADLIYGSLVRQSSTVKMRRIADNKEQAFKFYVAGKTGVLDTKIEYTGDDELIRYIPSSADDLKKSIEEIVKG